MAIAAPAVLLAAMLWTTGAVANEQAITAPGPLRPLAGTLRMPAGPPKAAALLIPGSGPTDRDGNNPLGIKASPLRLLAKGLSERGIASVRIDKRGMFGSAGAVPDANAVTVADYVADVAAWVDTIRARLSTGCVWAIGHSEGGLVALAAAQSVEHLCGLVLVAAPGRPMADVLRAQLVANPHNKPYLDDLLAGIETLEKGGSVETAGMPAVIRQLFAPQVQAYLRDLFSHDPAALIEGLTRPMLIVQGGNDLQVTIEDADRLAKANPQAERVDLPAMNHVLKDVAAGDVAANLASYGDAGLPLSAGLTATIADFIIGRR